MRKLLQKAVMAALILLLLSACDSTEKKQRTAEDYKKATKFMQRSWYGMVYNQIGSQKWTDDNTLVYSKKTKNGIEYISVNAKTKKKSILKDYKTLKTESKYGKATRNEHVSPNGK